MTCEVGHDVSRAATLIASGGLVAFPTETVYGLGANALDPRAVAGVFDAKGRPRFDPLIVHVTETSAAQVLTTDFPDTAARLARRFWPGPLTIVLPKVDRVPDLVTAGLPTVALRVPDHPLARELIARAGVPVAAPSANLFGRVSPTSAAHVQEQLGDRIDYLLDGGPCRVGLESTVLYLAGDQPTLLRPGGVSLEELTDVIGPIQPVVSEVNRADGPHASPGMLDRHYAPGTPLSLVDTLPVTAGRERIGVLTFGPLENAGGFAAVEILSSSGDLREAAANFYAALRRLDAEDLQQILALPFPEAGLGRALNDRLRRAAVSE